MTFKVTESHTNLSRGFHTYDCLTVRWYDLWAKVVVAAKWRVGLRARITDGPTIFHWTILYYGKIFLLPVILYITHTGHTSPQFTVLNRFALWQVRYGICCGYQSTPSWIIATLFITNCPSLRSPGCNKSRTLWHVLLSTLPNPVTSLPSFSLCTG